MVERGYGRVVNVSSGYGAFAEGLEGPAAYSISKAALNAVTVKAAEAVDGRHVKINAVCPGWVRTRMGGPSVDLSVEQGADTIVWLATLPPNGPHGRFFRRRKPISW
jgi:NAD(P)-dependent dehydrogenase (short-subunit alcohol dehydrogenase family)